MTFWLRVWLVLWLGGGIAFAAPQPVQVTDDAGREIKLLVPATRLITLAPSLAELAFAAGAGERLVGVSAYSDYPEAVRSLPQVADAVSVSIERILELKPDLILAWQGATPLKELERFNALGIPVAIIGVSKLDDVPRVLRLLGQLSNGGERSERAARAFETRIKALRGAKRSDGMKTAFVEISRQPLMTVNGEHFLSDILRTCGVRNVFADATQVVFEPSRESVLQAAPAVIIYGKSRQANPRPDARDAQLYKGLSAVRPAAMIGIDADHLMRPGPRMLDAAAALCAAISRP
jgi:iron complex transport system substrate-binding protein